MKITDIDRLAYNLYCEAVKNNKYIVHDYMVGHPDKFAENHKINNNNSLYYYNKAKTKLELRKLRKKKLIKLNKNIK